MNIKSIITLFTLTFLVTACPSTRYKTALEEIQENNMDLPNLKNRYFNGVKYKLSDLFSRDLDDSYVIQDNADVKIIYDIALRFSVELFDRDEAEDFQSEFSEEIDLLNAVHDQYAIRRMKSLHKPRVTIKKELPQEVPHNGYIQVIHGSDDGYSPPSSYFMATVEINGEFYVFQFIGSEESMGYLYDDFLDILKSIEA